MSLPIVGFWARSGASRLTRSDSERLMQSSVGRKTPIEVRTRRYATRRPRPCFRARKDGTRLTQSRGLRGIAPIAYVTIRAPSHYRPTGMCSRREVSAPLRRSSYMVQWRTRMLNMTVVSMP
jgi:hypothetical protein